MITLRFKRYYCDTCGATHVIYQDDADETGSGEEYDWIVTARDTEHVKLQLTEWAAEAEAKHEEWAELIRVEQARARDL